MIRDHNLFTVKVSWRYNPRIQDDQDSSHTDYSTVAIGEATHYVVAKREGQVVEWVQDRYKHYAIEGSLNWTFEEGRPRIDAFIEEHTW